ncbi:DUF6988 family protein [Janthinobacterium lividum]|uniref:DUF6988 family protein n=1 Tax=Janthinobacterium lividum TaxID=29581 RepID=UPI00140C5CBE|nr:hypothetical protein [Janthinobacterium lividum]NHQ93320.1 hypothetical protein [Janthinobacterium lividum]
MKNKDLELEMAHSHAVSEALQTMLGKRGEVSARSYVALAYLNMALDHREAILLLVGVGAFSSATALQRPLLEAAITGLWVESCATDTQVEEIRRIERPPPKFDVAARKLIQSHDFGKWIEIFRGHYKIFNDYTHGNERQLSRWLRSGTAGPCYDIRQMIETLHHTDLVGLLAAVQREKILDRPVLNLSALMESVLERSRLAQMASQEQ